MNYYTSFISLKDIKKSKCLEIDNIVNVIETSFIDFKNGDILLPDKISQVFDEKTQNRINCMPSTLIKERICGVKWVSVFPENPSKYNCPNVSGVIILSELERGHPIAIMDGSLITAFRTACVGAIAAKYLSRTDSKIYCSIGSGEQAKMHFRTIQHFRPSIKKCFVAAKDQKDEQNFINDLSKDYPHIDFVSCNSDYRKASKDADIIVTAVSCQAPLLKADSIKKGAFYCHVGGWEDEYEVPLKANKIICDNWDAVKHRTQTISRLYKSGELNDSDIYADLADIIDGTKLGRENDFEFIYFNSVGLAFIDVAIANFVYKKISSSDSDLKLSFINGFNN